MHLLLVFSNAAPGRDEEYNRWYTDEHLEHVLDVPGFRRAQRFLRCDIPAFEGTDPCDYRYLTVYELETEDLAGLIDEMHLRASGEKPGMPLTDSVGPTYASWVYTFVSSSLGSVLMPPGDGCLLFGLMEGEASALEDWRSGEEGTGARAFRTAGVDSVQHFRLADTQTSQLANKKRLGSPYNALSLFRLRSASLWTTLHRMKTANALRAPGLPRTNTSIGRCASWAYQPFSGVEIER